MITWFNSNSPAITALASIVGVVTSGIIVSLTISLSRFSKEQAKWTETSARTTEAIKEIERQRDFTEDPRAFIWFSGYSSHDNIANFVMQNSGNKNLFLQSLKLESAGMQVEFFSMEGQVDHDEPLASGGELRDLVITPTRVEKFHFRFKNGSGQPFELIAQLYTGAPVRLPIDPSKLNGYELRAVGSTELKAFCEGCQI